MRKKFIAAMLGLFAMSGVPLLLGAHSTPANAGDNDSGINGSIAVATHRADGTVPDIALAQQSQALPAATSVAVTSKDVRVEAHIKSLHDRLKITSAEEPQWNEFANVMRENAERMREAVDERNEARGMSAVDDLKAYQTIADAHARGLEKLIPAFQTLYDSMSDDQKKNADAIFSESHHEKKSGHTSG